MGAAAVSFFRSYYDALRVLPDKTRYGLYDAIFAYVFEEKEPEFSDPYMKACWSLIAPNLSASVKRAEDGARGRKKRSEKDAEAASRVMGMLRPPSGRREEKEACGLTISDKDKEREEDGEKEEEEGYADYSDISSLNNRRPMLGQICGFIEEEGFRVKAAEFWSYYNARGWKSGGRPVTKENCKSILAAWDARAGAGDG